MALLLLPHFMSTVTTASLVFPRLVVISITPDAPRAP